MKNITYCLLGIVLISLFSCKAKDVNKLSKKDYINNQYKELKELLPEADISIINDTIKILFPNNLLFKTNEYEVNESSEPLMGRLAGCLNKYIKTTVMVCGHTDNVGKSGFNQELSQKRADYAKMVLEKNKVDAKRLHSWGFGERQPIADNNSEESRSRNRRVEFIILIDNNASFRK